MEDLRGVNRPPSFVQAGTNTVATFHEAALAVCMLRILGRGFGTGPMALQQEAERTYTPSSQKTYDRARHVVHT